MSNKNESQTAGLIWESRDELKFRILEKLPDNYTKLITPEMLRNVVNTVVESVPNFAEDSVDLRSYHSQFFLLSDCALSAGFLSFTLDFVPVNPADGSCEFEIEGVRQSFGTDYTIETGGILKFPTDSYFNDSHYFAVKYRYLN